MLFKSTFWLFEAFSYKGVTTTTTTIIIVMMMMMMMMMIMMIYGKQTLTSSPSDFSPHN